MIPSLFSRLARRAAAWQAPTFMLIALLQRTPVLRVFAAAESFAVSSPFGQVLKASALVATMLGAVDTLAGATAFMTNPASPVEATVGTPFAGVFFLGGGGTVTVGSYTIAGLPPGLSVPNATMIGGRLTLNGANDGDNITGSITGTPTQAGDFAVLITAWDNINHTGESFLGTYAISVVEGNEAAPVITGQPTSVTVTAGQQAVFSVTATGSPALTFQWRKNGANINGAISSTYTIAAASSGDAGNYTVVVTNPVGSVTSTGAALAVNQASAAPVITTQPLDRAVLSGTSATFTVGASGTPAPTYQWRKNNVAIGGATNSNYTVANVTAADVGSYTVVVTNSAGSATSSGAMLTLTLGLAAEDFNADGKSDIFLSNTATGDRVIWTMNGSVVSTNAFVGTVPANWVVSATGDFNGDGKADIFWTNTTTGDRAVWLMNGSTAVAGGYLGAIPVAWVVSGTGDFNGDGKADILWTNTVTGERSMWFMNGIVTAGGASLGVVPLNWAFSGTADFNGDGKSDIFLSNTATGDRVIWLMNGTVINTNAFVGTIPVNWVVSATGDFNGDGKADVFWTNTTTGDRAVWLMNGSTNIGGGYLGAIPVAWVVNRTGDFNGDGKADILWTNTLTGERSMWFMNGIVTASGASLGVVPLSWVFAN